MADNNYAVQNLQQLKENIIAYASFAEGYMFTPLFEKIEQAQEGVQKLIDAIEGKPEEPDEDEPEFKVHELCCDKDIFEAEEIVKKEFGAKFSDNGINDGLEDGVYLMYRSYSLPNGKSIVLYYPNDTNIVTDTRYY